MDRRSSDGTPLTPPCPGDGDPSLGRPHSRRTVPDEAAELIAVDRAMQRAVLERDLAGFAAFLADDYVLVDSGGHLQDKAAVLREMANPDVRVTANEAQDHQVRVHGDVAVVIAVLQQRGIDHCVPYDLPVLFTDTWMYRDGRWVCLSGHASRLALPTRDVPG